MDISNVMLTDLIIIRATTSGANQFHLEISESSTALNKALWLHLASHLMNSKQSECII